jgi:hypothetical protein
MRPVLDDRTMHEEDRHSAEVLRMAQTVLAKSAATAVVEVLRELETP